MEQEDNIQAQIADGLENLVTGVGTNMDKSTYNEWSHSGKNYDHVSLSARFREDWISQKIVTIPAIDVTRRWRKIDSEEGQAQDKKWCIETLFRDALKWSRLYGTSYILIEVKGGGSLSTPLNLKRLKAGCIKSLRVVDRTRIVPTGIIDQDAMSIQFGMPMFYSFVGSQEHIHFSRLIRFEATELPLYETMRNQWVSDSILLPLFDLIDNYHSSSKAAANLAQESMVDVVAVEGLKNILTNPEGTAAMQRRFRMMKQMKSTMNIILLDSDEEYNTKTINLSGVTDYVWEQLRIVAAAAGIPATRFLSTQPTGLNATGDADMEQYVDTLEGIQENVFTPRIDLIDEILQIDGGVAPWTYEWECLFPESAVKETEREASRIDSVTVLVDSGIITTETALAILKAEGIFGAVDLGSAPTDLPVKQQRKSESVGGSSGDSSK